MPMMCTVHVLCLVSVASAMPLPFPLPVNYSLGVCGMDPGLLPNCSASMSFAHTATVRCSPRPGCSTACEASPLFQRVFSRYAARLGSSSVGTSDHHVSRTVPPPSPNLTQPNPAVRPSDPARPVATIETSAGSRHWWALPNINCNLHDVPSKCHGMTIAQCQTTCANEKDCGGFLYYSKTGEMALK